MSIVSIQGYCLSIFVTLLLAGTRVHAAQWTFMVYLDGDNNLESEAIEDFLEMASVGSGDGVNIVVQFDRIGGDDDRFGDWTGAKRFRVTHGMTPSPEQALADLGEVDMGDPRVLTSFIRWAKVAYPADRYALILWNHGGGWRSAKAAGPVYRDICLDQTSGNMMKMRQVRQALLDAGPVDVIGFDACIMGMIEVAYELRETAQIMVGSEDLEIGTGWPYDAILGNLTTDPTLGPDSLAGLIVNRYAEGTAADVATMSAVALPQVPALVNSVADLARALIADTNSGDHRPVLAAAQEVIGAFPAAVIAERHVRDTAFVHGLTIYFPASADAFDGAYTDATIDFPGDTGWDKFLNHYYVNPVDSWVVQCRTGAEDFYHSENVDLYDFAQRLSGTAGGLADAQRISASADSSISNGAAASPTAAPLLPCTPMALILAVGLSAVFLLLPIRAR